MKYNKIIPLVCILLVFIFSVCIYAYSGPVRRFIEKDKYMRILLHKSLINYSFKLNKKVEVICLGKDPHTLKLESGKYKIRLSNTVSVWQIQLFATKDKKKAGNLKEKLENNGYEKILVRKVDNLYKIIIPEIKNRQLAEELEAKLIADGWSPWIKKVEVITNKKTLFLINKEGKILCRGINIILKGDIESANKKLPGKFEFLLTDKGIKVYNIVKLNTILLGTLCSQYFNCDNPGLEKVKAQAVINRTYLINKLFSDKNSYKDIPFYKGIYGDCSLLRKAVYYTEGEVLAGYKSGEQDLITIPVEISKLNIKYREILKRLASNYKLINLINKEEEKTTVNTYVVQGVNYREIRQLTWWGPRVLTILDINMDKSNVSVDTHLANNKIPDLVDLGDTVRKEEALAGINGGFFSYTGRPLGFMMTEGLVVSEPLKPRTVLCITSNGEILFERLKWQGVITDSENKNKSYITGVNRVPNNNEIVMYNKFYGKKASIISGAVQLIVDGGIVKRKIVTGKGELLIPESGYILVARGDKKKIINRYDASDDIIYRDDFIPDSLEEFKIISALEAGPRLLKGGKIFITGKQGDFQNDIINGRAPRSAVGVTPDRHLVFITVDGRQPELSIGMTLEELATFMKDYGITNAMNLDGGSSARMVVRGYTMSNPSKKRLIADEIIIKIKENEY